MTDRAPDPIHELSEREREILKLLATGAPNKEIAQQSGISPNTVSVHLRNIYAKLGVTSRTEATLIAIQSGLVRVPAPAEAAAPAPSELAPAPPTAAPRPGLRWGWGLAMALVAVAVVGLGWWALPRLGPAPAPTPTPMPELPRWQQRAPLPAPRSAPAVAVYANQMYVIGGETDAGVSAAVDRYDAAADVWAGLAPKPVAVTDAQAVVLGGKIYVPGGRLASGAPSAALEVYDPATDQWAARAPLPKPVSAAAAASFEGRLFVFGGWDGQRPVAEVWEYDPGADAWRARAPLAEARSLASAALAGGRLYVMGGQAADGPLATVEVYQPEEDRPGGQPWQTGVPLPAPRAGANALGLADLIYLVGGEAVGTAATDILSFTPGQTAWQSAGALAPEAEAAPLSRPGVAALATEIFVFGGRRGDQPSAALWSYPVIYTISIPIIVR